MASPSAKLVSTGVYHEALFKTGFQAAFLDQKLMHMSKGLPRSRNNVLQIGYWFRKA
jgi:hypothetical protein